MRLHFRQHNHLLFGGLITLLSVNGFAQEAPRKSQSSGLEEIVVTAGRNSAKRGDVAQQMEVVSALTLTRTPASFITDVLKKSTSVDVIQYPGGLSGIGMRGFRPQFSGVNQQVLVLVDGRPAGATSLGTLPQSSITRVEVIKGSSSAVYGASAMGGVVNFITRESSGPISGDLSVRTGSFGTLRGGFNLGGDLSEKFSFDIGFEERSQANDFKVGKEKKAVSGLLLGDGATRPNTAFDTRSIYSRLGMNITEDWVADVRVHRFIGRNVESPGAETNGISNQASRDSDVEGIDARLAGTLGEHSLQFVLYSTKEETVNTDFVNNAALLSGTFVENTMEGFQISDAWNFSDRFGVVAGIDSLLIEKTGGGNNARGVRIGPTSPDEKREEFGVYVDVTARLVDERLILNAGVRSDRIESHLERTDLRPDFISGGSTFTTVNPRAGAVYYPSENRAVRLHASIGRGFVAPSVRQVAGSSEGSGTGGQVLITSGNPNLKPESSVSVDAGIGYESDNWGTDITWFRTKINDSIETIITLNTPSLRLTTNVNANSSLAQGVEASFEGRPETMFGIDTRGVSYGFSATYYSDFEQKLATGSTVLRNVARFKVNGNVSYESERFGLTLSARHVAGMHDNDFSRFRVFTQGRGGLFTFPDISLFDLSARYYFSEKQTLGIQVENINDEYYFEKNDYPMPGRMVIATYSYAF